METKTIGKRDDKGRFVKGHKFYSGGEKEWFKKGVTPWNKGKEMSNKTKEKMSKILLDQYKKNPNRGFKKGHKTNLGKKCKENTKKKISIAHIGKKLTGEHKKNLSLNYTYHINSSCFKKGENMGVEHPNWNGGSSFEPYGLEFNDKLKEQIRKKYNYRCIECGYSQLNLGYKLPIHHIDYNKQNNNLNNLIPLCRSCHSQSNFKRNDWITYFKEKMEVGYNGE